MNLRSLILVPIALAALGGCSSLSKSECLSADWADVGVRDGANGRGEEYLIQHSKACAKVHVTPDRDRWLKGRERGLERFCVPYRAYQIGEYGGGFDVGLCRGFDEERLLNAYEQGREVHRLAGEVGSLDSEIRDIRATLEKKDLEQKERERLAYRLGQLEYQRGDAQRAYEDARYRARNL
jgi:Protein of unknown function (DUF2799)